MAEEDKLREEVGDMLIKVCRFPRPSIRNQLLMDIMLACAAHLGVKVEWENKDGR